MKFLFLEVYDALGRLVARRRWAAGAGVQDVGIPLRGLSAGAYAVRVSWGEEASVRRLTVVR